MGASEPFAQFPVLIVGFVAPSKAALHRGRTSGRCRFLYSIVVGHGTPKTVLRTTGNIIGLCNTRNSVATCSGLLCTQQRL